MGLTNRTTVLVIGGAGFIGSHVTAELLRRGRAAGSWPRLHPCTGRVRELPKTERPFGLQSSNWKRIASWIF